MKSSHFGKRWDGMGSEGVTGRGLSVSTRPTLCSARRRHVGPRRSLAQSVLAVLAVFGCFVVAAIGSTTLAGAAGILPPSNPPGNIAPSDSDWLTSIDAARAVEGVGPMEVDETMLDSLPAPEQLFIVLNDERIDRGLPPIEYMSAQLNAVAAQSAASATDVVPPSSLSNGTAVTFGGAVWAGLSSVLESDYLWMYDDGSAGARRPPTRRARRRRRRCAGCTATSFCTASPRAARSLRCSPWERRTTPGRWAPSS